MQVKFTRSILAGAAVALGLAVATPSTAEAQMGFVVQANYGADSEFGAGAGINMGLGSLTTSYGIRGEATFNYYFNGFGGDYWGGGIADVDSKFWQIDANALMDIKSVSGLYVGAGVNYGKASIDCESAWGDCGSWGNGEIGLNVLGGWNFSGSKGPFAQAKLGLGGYDQLVISGGIRF